MAGKGHSNGEGRPCYKGGYRNRGSLAWANTRLYSNRASSLKRGKLPTTCTVEQFRALYEACGGKCEICGASEAQLSKGLALDHNHETGKPRGFVCGPCNHIMGLVGDRVAVLKNAIKYLEDRNG